ncbi:MAG TPA: DUF2884 family protein [Rhodanobacteraceae bacterium]|nr:DUF2884 family protein [Rhodanobacteraceae bacterium]
MTTLRTFSFVLLLCVLPALGGCGAGQPSGGAGTQSEVGRAIAAAMDEARDKLRTNNIDIDSDHLGMPRAEISPRGDLLIAGKAVAVTPQQRALLLEYRSRIIDVAEAGMEIGRQGADLGIRAAGEALSAAFAGKSDREIEQRVKAQASDIKRAAAQLCDRLPALREAQQKLASALPEFAPYATITESDIDKCRRNAERGRVDFDTAGMHASP